MAIHQTKKQTDLEKRLRLLRQQVYGQESEASSKQYVVREEKTQKNTHTTNLPFGGPLPTTDVIYLRQDLFKILTLSTLAIGTQLALFFLSENHILNINLF